MAVKDRRGFKLIEALVVMAFLLVLVGLALPAYVKLKDRAQEAEIKQHAHSIQLGVERYSVDNEFSYSFVRYPGYLIGGSAKYSQPGSASDATTFAKVADCPDTTTISDPLLREGYLTEYPMNPFAAKLAIHNLQCDLPTDPTGADALRNGTETAKLRGTRFGADCTLMGNVLADPRWSQWADPSQRSGKPVPIETFAAVEYHMWDWDRRNPPHRYLAGQFFYKTDGVYNTDLLKDADELLPSAEWEPTATKRLVVGRTQPVWSCGAAIYCIGAYGNPRQKGIDTITEELPLRSLLTNEHNQALESASWDYVHALVAADYSVPHGSAGFDRNDHSWKVATGEIIQVEYWPWVRSTNSAIDYGGVPLGVMNGNPTGSKKLNSWNRANGIPDGVIVQLNSGMDKRSASYPYAPDPKRLPRRPGRFGEFVPMGDIQEN